MIDSIPAGYHPKLLEAWQYNWTFEFLAKFVQKETSDRTELEVSLTW